MSCELRRYEQARWNFGGGGLGGRDSSLVGSE